MKSNFSDIGTEHAVLLVLRPDIGLWYVSLNSINVAALSCLETKKIENYLLECLPFSWLLVIMDYCPNHAGSSTARPCFLWGEGEQRSVNR